MRVSADVVQALWRRLRDEETVHQMTFPDGPAEAIDLCAGPGACSVLRADGNIFEWVLTSLSAPIVFQPSGEHSAMQALALAARRLPELRAALPSRTGQAVDCSKCGGHGFLDLGDVPKFLVCDGCDGLGWRAA